MPTTELSWSPSTNRRSAGRSASRVISVEPGFAKRVISSYSRRTPNVASRTVGAVTAWSLEGERLGLLPRGQPLPFRPELELGDAAEVAAVRRGLEASERRRRLLVHRLVVDVHHAGVQSLGDLGRPGPAAGLDGGRQAVVGRVGQL